MGGGGGLLGQSAEHRHAAVRPLASLLTPARLGSAPPCHALVWWASSELLDPAAKLPRPVARCGAQAGSQACLQAAMVSAGSCVAYQSFLHS